MANYETITIAVDLNGLTNTSSMNSVLITSASFATDVTIGPSEATITGIVEDNSVALAVALG
jgi:hypothetical protein